MSTSFSLFRNVVKADILLPYNKENIGKYGVPRKYKWFNEAMWEIENDPDLKLLKKKERKKDDVAHSSSPVEKEEVEDKDEEEQEQEQENPLLSHKSSVQLDSRITMTTGKQVDRRRKELKNLGQCSEAFLEPSLLACARHRGGSSQISSSGDKEEEDAFQQLPLQQQVKTVLAKKMIER